jgi:small subunit ribosomal protein S14
MAKKSILARESKRTKLVEQYKARRDELRKQVVNPSLSEDEREEARFKLSKLPRDSSPCRLSRRCGVTGVSRAVYRKFQMNRITFRKMALEGMLPGVTKSSW